MLVLKGPIVASVHQASSSVKHSATTRLSSGRLHQYHQLVVPLCTEASAGTGAQQTADLKSVGEASVATAGDADLVWQEENVSMVCSCLCLSLRASEP